MFDLCHTGRGHRPDRACCARLAARRLVPAPAPPAAPAAAAAAAAVVPGAGAVPAGAAVGAPLPAVAGAALAAAAAPPPAAMGGVPAAAAPAGGHVQDARTLPVVYDADTETVRTERPPDSFAKSVPKHAATHLITHRVQEDERACRTLEELLCFDQCNGAYLASAELLVRAIQVQHERYRDRSAGGSASGGPDSVDTHLFVDSELTRGNVGVCPLFQEWASAQLAKEQALLKERRKARVGRDLAKKGNKTKGKKEEEG